jgi:hypothetical protein
MKWPPEKGGACGKAPASRYTKPSEDNRGSGFAQVCWDPLTRQPVTHTERLGDDHVHFAATAFALTHSSLQNNFPHLRGQTAFRKKERHSEKTATKRLHNQNR